MKVFFQALSLVVVAAVANNAGVTPIQKVIQMLEGMSVQGKEEKHNEQVAYSQYKLFCDETDTQKSRDISEANEKAESLKADMAKTAADAKRLGKEIAGHIHDINTWNDDIKAASAVRQMEKADNAALGQDYAESLSALARAIEVLKKNRGGASLAQLSAVKELALVPGSAKREIDAYLQTLNNDAQGATLNTVSAANEGPEMPEVATYEFQSGGVVGMLEKLLEQFKEQQTALTQKERDAQNAFDLLLQDLNAQIANGEGSRDSKKDNKAKAEAANADAASDLTETETLRASDTKYLSDVKATCAQKAADFASRQKLRGEEIEAITTAIKILSGDSVSGAGEKHLPKLLQTSGAAVFGQLRSVQSDASRQQASQARVASYLRARADELQSKVLSTVAARAAADPFVKVRKMIADLIAHLKESAAEEAEHKQWCDTEMASNKATRQEKSDQVESLSAEISGIEAAIEKLSEEIKASQKTIADLTKTMTDETKDRTDEKAANTQTIKDAKEARVAVAQAVSVLKEFYAKAGEATAFAQQNPSQPPAPEIFEDSYKGMQTENGGVLGMLEVIETDFARLESETSASEAKNQDSYDALMAESKASVAANEKAIEEKTAKKQDQTQAKTLRNEDLVETKNELEVAQKYHEKLKPSCVDAGSDYKTRTAKRDEELASLREALDILNDWQA